MEVAGRGAAAEAASLFEGGMTITVIGSPLLLVLEDVVGFVDFAEFLIGGGIVGIAVGMHLHCQLAVGLLDLLRSGALGNAEDVVVVAFAHAAPIDHRWRTAAPGKPGAGS